ncbi:efflux RND transporter permease subunit [Hahella sp. KA22]|uniref:efflux RND transporter permease subunit n=1 Tax=Hahella sp. KA22 TaxID=1628392 RepID=UPI000FDE1AFC|nr:efflux RND transporter permease subunit [Hahella sp. KA22]AZZ90721.1 efflux RND transporter permease subunit [Hahella sp. KA22]QAY54091.1 efflux RND transporter permease subunit [Hahella sp. KA22]
MIRFFATHPTAANLLMGFFMFIGVMTLPQIKRETFPEIKSYEVEVKVAYPGATPTDIELSVCKPLEEAVEGVSFMEEVRCEARNSMGLMTLKMLEDGDFDDFIDDVKSAVDEISSLPDQSEEPVVKELGRTQNVVTIALTADLPRSELKTLAEEVKQRILRNPDIPLVDIQGFSDRQFQIQAPESNLRQYGLSLQDIANLVAKQDVDLPAGDVKTDYRDYQIRFSDEKRTVTDLENLVVLRGGNGAEVRLGDIAKIVDEFELEENKSTFDGKPAAFLKISKNTRDDSLRILQEVETFIAEESQRLPPEVTLSLTQDYTSVVKDRISMLSSNAWQGLVLVFAVMWLFFGARYAFWVVMGLPVSFLASAFVLGHMGVSINMLSMVALLLALGILMDDAIVISESIGTEMRKGKRPLQAAVDGTLMVAKGVFSSFLTTLCMFTGLLFLEGDIGQVLVVVPIVLISVITLSLIEAFFILPHHLQHSLAHAEKQQDSRFRVGFEQRFEKIRQGLDRRVSVLIKHRYGFVGAVIATFILCVSLLASGVIKFSAFPDLEGDIVQARLIMPTGTSQARTEAMVAHYSQALEQTASEFNKEQDEPAIGSVTVNYGQNADAFETGPHLATISVDLLTAERRNFSLQAFTSRWRELAGETPDVWSVLFKEPTIGPGGRAIEIRLRGDDLESLSLASHELQNWLAGYPGVINLLDDLRPGKPEFTLHLKSGAYDLGLDAQTIAAQLRAAFQGVTVLESSVGLETYEVVVRLDDESRDELADFDNFPIVHPASKALIPLSNVAEIIPSRSYSRINRVDNQRTVTVYGDVDISLNNTKAVIGDMQKHFLPQLQQRYPDIQLSIQGEIKEGAATQGSMKLGFLMGLAGIFILLSFQFKSYVEPVIVMLNIPMAFIGVIVGHVVMGMDITMPSLLGFVSLAGIVVNDSILLVEFVKMRVGQGMNVHDAAAKASHDRFRAVLLTSLTTMAGMTPLLFETSLQAQILIPLATSIVFGVGASTLLVLFVIPCVYTILEDFGLTRAVVGEPEEEFAPAQHPPPLTQE